MNSSEAEDLPERVREGLRAYEHEGSSSRYERLEEIGRGGMGVVYRARDRELNRTVALKLIREEAVRIPTVLRRFQREAETAARLVHPNLVTVHDVGEEDGRPFLVMELVDGEPLDSLLRRKDRTWADLIPLLIGVARGVSFAHEHGVVHRDLKPANILVGGSGEPKVADFGLAHLVNPETFLTKSDATLGTPNYMAPEQVQGGADRITVRTDVYALGAILYEVLTGAPPHHGGTVLEIFDRIVRHEPCPPRRANPEIPADLEAVCLKALEKDESRRYPSAREFADDLQRFRDGENVFARPPSWVRKSLRAAKRHKPLTVGVSFLLLFSVGLVSYAMVRSWLRSRERDRLVRGADRAIRDRDWDRGARLYGEALVLAPDDPVLPVKRRAAEEMARAVRAMTAREGARRRIRAIRLPAVSATDPASAREKRWELETFLEAAKREKFMADRDAEHAALAALAFDPGLAEARGILAELYLDRHEEAAGRFDRPGADLWERQTLLYGGAEYRDRVQATLSVSSRPPGAHVFLFRYEERKGRLFPFPYSPSKGTREIPIPPVDPASSESPVEDRARLREGSAYPLQCDGWNRVASPVRLRPGSYLVLLRKTGFADARVSVALEHGRKERLEVRLLRPREIPSGFVYVPAGRYLAGGDPVVEENSTRPRAREEHTVAGYFIARYSVTCDDYLKFLNDRTYHDESAVKRYLPRLSRRTLWRSVRGVFVLPEWIPKDHPVSYLPRSAADAYAKWYTSKRGGGTLTFRLPTEDEWEKAARGADGRFYPWGNRFDPSFADSSERNVKVAESHGKIRNFIGLCPADESPYGARDMAGGISNWTTTQVSEGMSITKGGAFSTMRVGCRAALRKNWFSTHSPGWLGFRLAASVPAQ